MNIFPIQNWTCPKTRCPSCLRNWLIVLSFSVLTLVTTLMSTSPESSSACQRSRPSSPTTIISWVGPYMILCFIYDWKLWSDLLAMFIVWLDIYLMTCFYSWTHAISNLFQFLIFSILCKIDLFFFFWNFEDHSFSHIIHPQILRWRKSSKRKPWRTLTFVKIL